MPRIRNRYHSEASASQIAFDRVRPITMYMDRKMYMKKDDGWVCDKKLVKLMLINVINDLGFFVSGTVEDFIGIEVCSRKPSMRGIYGFLEARIVCGGDYHIFDDDKYYDEKRKMILPKSSGCCLAST